MTATSPTRLPTHAPTIRRCASSPSGSRRGCSPPSSGSAAASSRFRCSSWSPASRSGSPTATSLLAIAITASAGVIVFGLRGEVDVGYAALVGLPAAVGALGGARLQQRIRTSTLTYGFAALLTGVGVWLLVVVSVQTVVARDPARPLRRRAAGLFGVGGGILFVPDARRARARAARGSGDVAAGDPPDRPSRAPEPAALREPPRARPPLIVGLGSVVGVEVGARSSTSLPEDDAPEALRRPPLRRRGPARVATRRERGPLP